MNSAYCKDYYFLSSGIKGKRRRYKLKLQYKNKKILPFPVGSFFVSRHAEKDIAFKSGGITEYLPFLFATAGSDFIYDCNYSRSIFF